MSGSAARSAQIAREEENRRAESTHEMIAEGQEKGTRAGADRLISNADVRQLFRNVEHFVAEYVCIHGLPFTSVSHS
jgi:hypothetical protein